MTICYPLSCFFVLLIIELSLFVRRTWLVCKVVFWVNSSLELAVNRSSVMFWHSTMIAVLSMLHKHQLYWLHHLVADQQHWSVIGLVHFSNLVYLVNFGILNIWQKPMAETCFCRTGLNWFKPRFKPPLAETCQPWFTLTWWRGSSVTGQQWWLKYLRALFSMRTMTTFDSFMDVEPV